MRLNAKQIDADRKLAKAYADDALREAVCRWSKEHLGNRARTARAFGISVQRVATYEFTTSMIEGQARYEEEVRNNSAIPRRLFRCI